MFFFPIGLQDGSVARMPWVCISIAILAIGIHVAASNADARLVRETGEATTAVVEYWQAHPYLEIPDAFSRRFLPSVTRTGIAELHEQALDQIDLPGDEARKRQQSHLNELAERALASDERSVVTKWGLVPARGFLQRGVIGHIFVHGGWMHLIGNLFFLYLVGPFLEDMWGRPVFAGFFVVGGMLAGASQAALDHSSALPVIGASGAVAACMGAFAVRFATRKVRVLYWIFFTIGTFAVPAWLWAGFWFVREVVDFWLIGKEAPIAFMAHIGGFIVGAGIATAFRLANLEELFIKPALDGKQGVWKQNPLVERAQAALAAGQGEPAERLFRAALGEEPANLDAALGLARLLLQAGDRRGASAAVGETLGRADDVALQAIVEELGDVLDPTAWRSALAFRIGQRLEAVRPAVAAACYESAGRAEGALAAKALVHAAEVRLRALNDPAAAVRLAERAQSLRLAPDLAERAAAVFERAAAAPAISGGAIPLSAGEPPTPGPASSPGLGLEIEVAAAATQAAAPPPARRPAVSIETCKFAGRQPGGLVVERQGGKRVLLPPTHVAGVAVGLVDSVPGRSARVLVLDVVLPPRAGGPERALRFFSDMMGLGTLFPADTQPQQALRSLLEELLAQATPRGAADVGAILAGRYPRYANLAEMQAASYGT